MSERSQEARPLARWEPVLCQTPIGRRNYAGMQRVERGEFVRYEDLLGRLSVLTREREEAISGRDLAIANHRLAQTVIAMVSRELDAARRDAEGLRAENERMMTPKVNPAWSDDPAHMAAQLRLIGVYLDKRGVHYGNDVRKAAKMLEGGPGMATR